MFRPRSEMLQVGGSAFKRILFTGQVARVVARPCYGGLLRSRETWLFGGMAIEHVYIYMYPFRHHEY